jgi:hypothetical protein
VPEDDGYRIAEELKATYGGQLEKVKATRLSVSNRYHMMEDGRPRGLKWTDFLFEGKEESEDKR